MDRQKSNKQYFKSKIRAKGQITLPAKLRDFLGAAEGDDVEFCIEDNGFVLVQKVKTIPHDQAWFWTQRWQKMEREAQEDIAVGRVHKYDSVEEGLNALE